ncbi:hypothetical protein [Deinococcus roseus]|nr:hypothetical protein [Deinococcus roseus]
MIEAVPLLKKQRALYEVPRGMERFQAYLDLMIDGHPERLPTLPLQALNPMAREHVAERLDELIAAGADGWLQDFAAELNARLPDRPDRKICWVMVDDVKGGWTHRYLNDASARFNQAKYHLDWIPVMLWVSEDIKQENLRRSAFSNAFRHFYMLQHGAPETLQQMLDQEGQAQRFAEIPLTFSAEELEYTSEVLRPHLQSTHFPTLFTCMYGDHIAEKVGYPPQGLSDLAGFEWSLAQALKQHI